LSFRNIARSFKIFTEEVKYFVGLQKYSRLCEIFTMPVKIFLKLQKYLTKNDKNITRL
jgi:hypothetical protein